jgi:hypothetical protein
VVTASPVGALAQTQPIPKISSPGTPSSAQDPAVASAGSGLSQSWDYSLGVGLGYASNVSLTGQGPSDYGGVFRATLARRLRSAKGEGRLSARGLGYVYAEQKDCNTLNGGIDFDGSTRLSTRTTGALTLGLSSDETQNTLILLEQGTLLPPTRTVTYSGRTSVVFQSTVRTAWRGAVDASRVDFPESETLRASSSLRLISGLDRRLNERDTFAIEYSADRASRSGATSSTASLAYWTHYGSSQWTRRLSPDTAFLVEAGASYSPQGIDAGLASQWNFFGGVSLNRRVKRSSLSAYYRREVIPVFGVGGLRLADRVGLNANMPFGQRWSTSFGGTYAGTTQQDANAGRQTTIDSYAAIMARMSRRLWLSATGRYLSRSAVDLVPAVDDYRLSLSLVLAPPGSTPPAVPWR